MVAWYWLIVAFIVGGMLGIFMSAWLGANHDYPPTRHDEHRDG